MACHKVSTYSETAVMEAKEKKPECWGKRVQTADSGSQRCKKRFNLKYIELDHVEVKMCLNNNQLVTIRNRVLGHLSIIRPGMRHVDICLGASTNFFRTVYRMPKGAIDELVGHPYKHVVPAHIGGAATSRVE
ncbi:hypothetical protein DFH09DRAFT_1100462 [Mycena vulgaris]|nr:hypothetical protein DFH09DRAFT_1100462 [Mycena vulgaris]